MNKQTKHANGLISLALCSGLAVMAPVQSTQAGSTGGAFVGGLVGGAIGSAIVNERYRSKEKRRYRTTNKTYRKKRTRTATARVSSEGVKLQKALAATGVYSGPIDGNMDSYASRSAVMAYQQRNNLPQTGVLQPDVKNVLFFQSEVAELSGHVNYMGYNKRDRARRLQAALKVQGYYNGKIDGAIGRGSKSAIRQYQQANGMISSGALLPEQEDDLASNSAARLQQQHTQAEQQLQQIAARSQPQQAPVAQQAAPQQQYQQPAYNTAPQQMQPAAPVPVNTMPAPQQQQQPAAPIPVNTMPAPQQQQQPAANPAVNAVQPQYVGVSNQ